MTVQNIIAILTAVGVILTAVVGILNRVHILETRKNVDGVKHIVNSQADRQTARVDQLASALSDAGLNVPPRPDVAPAEMQTPPPPETQAGS